MRQRNRLYTVNRYNKPMFQGDRLYQNIFDGENTSFLQHAKAAYTGGDYGLGDGVKVTTSAVTSGGGLFGSFGSSFKDAAGSFGGMSGLGSSLGSAIGSNISGIGSAVGGAIGGLIGSGYQSGVGNALGSLGKVASVIPGPWGAAISGGLQVLGGGVNALFGTKVDQAKLNAANEGTSSYRNFTSSANSFDDISGPVAQANVQDAYSGGVFKKGWARKRNEELKRQRSEAMLFADRSIGNNIGNLADDQMNDAFANYAAYGGPLDFGGGALGLMQQNRYFDTIDKRSNAIAERGQSMQTGFTKVKTFADGGLKSAFLDEFGKDPIGAAVRYNHGLEALAAQEEAKQMEAAREKEYADMQKRMLQLETENQGLQALMAANHSTTALPEIPETSASSTPSRATSGGSTWDYIEDQLRRSGRFNDNQIQGIKYNLQRESSIDPGAIGDGGQAFGLGQWHGSRKPTDMSLEGQTRHLIDTISNFDGKDHWIRRSDYEGFLNARTPEEAHYYLAKGYERPRADIVAKVKRDSDMSLKRLNAFGGELGTNGTDFTNGLLYIDEGGSHESNPLDGVPMGLDPQGIPNLVEEGETVYNDYVFSDRMKVPFFMYKELGLGGVMKKKGKEMSFADASKKLAQESEKRPNDPISQDGLQASLSRLAEVQETERMRKQAKEYMGLEGYACGGKMGNKYGGDNPFGQQIIRIGASVPQSGYLSTYNSNGLVPWNTNFNIDFSRFGNPDTSYMPDLDNMMLTYDVKTAEKNKESKPRTQPSVDTSTGGSRNNYGKSETNGPKVKKELPPLEVPQPGSVSFVQDPTKITKEDLKNLQEKVSKAQERYGSGSNNNPPEYDTWMRYAPAVGAGIMTLTDALGLTNRPDYTYADKITAAAERAGYAPSIEADPIGNYLKYNPMDIWYQQNALNAQARATDRALNNTTSTSRAAGLLANGYNSQLASGNLYRQALEYNDAKKKDVEEFNRKTNMFNSQMGLEADMANARYHQVAQQMGLSGLAQAAALREQVDARTGAARSANLTNFLTSLGNIGRENFAMNQINFDPSRHYYGDLRGRSGYKKKCGGKMNRK